MPVTPGPVVADGQTMSVLKFFVHTWQKIDSNCGLISEKSTKRNTNTIAQSQVALLAQMNNG